MCFIFAELQEYELGMLCQVGTAEGGNMCRRGGHRGISFRWGQGISRGWGRSRGQCGDNEKRAPSHPVGAVEQAEQGHSITLDEHCVTSVGLSGLISEMNCWGYQTGQSNIQIPAQAKHTRDVQTDRERGRQPYRQRNTQADKQEQSGDQTYGEKQADRQTRDIQIDK